MGNDNEQRKKMFSRILEVSAVRPELLKLPPACLVSDIGSTEFRLGVEEMYRVRQLNPRLVATVFLAAIAGKRRTFLFCRTILEKLLLTDQNQKSRTTLSGDEYKDFMLWAKENKILAVVQQSKTYGEGSLIQIIDEEFLRFFATILDEKQLLDCDVRIFENYQKLTSNRISKKTSTEITSNDKSCSGNENDISNNNTPSPSSASQSSADPRAVLTIEQKLNDALKTCTVPKKKQFIEGCLSHLSQGKHLSEKQIAILEKDIFVKLTDKTTQAILTILPDAIDPQNPFDFPQKLTLTSVEDFIKYFFFAYGNRTVGIATKKFFGQIERIDLYEISYRGAPYPVVAGLIIYLKKPRRLTKDDLLRIRKVNLFEAILMKVVPVKLRVSALQSQIFKTLSPLQDLVSTLDLIKDHFKGLTETQRENYRRDGDFLTFGGDGSFSFDQETIGNP